MMIRAIPMTITWGRCTLMMIEMLMVKIMVMMMVMTIT